MPTLGNGLPCTTQGRMITRSSWGRPLKERSVAASWRALACAIVIRAIQDDVNAHLVGAGDARHFLESEGCVDLMALALGWSPDFARERIETAILSLRE